VPLYKGYDQYCYLLFTLPLIIGARKVVETGLHLGHSTRIFLESARILRHKRLSGDEEEA